MLLWLHEYVELSSWVLQLPPQDHTYLLFQLLCATPAQDNGPGGWRRLGDVRATAAEGGGGGAAAAAAAASRHQVGGGRDSSSGWCQGGRHPLVNMRLDRL